MNQTFYLYFYNSAATSYNLLWLLATCCLFFTLVTHCNLVQGQGATDTSLYRLNIFDSFGNKYTLADIAAKELPPVSCQGNGINFEFIYTDSNIQTLAQDVVCQVFTDISYLLQVAPDPCTSATPTLRIEVGNIDDLIYSYLFDTPPTDILGAATAFYCNIGNVDNQTDGYNITYSTVWRIINGGADPFASNAYATNSLPPSNSNNCQYNHGLLLLKSTPPAATNGSSITWNTNFSNPSTFLGNYPANQSTDLYQIVLHETMHLLGISSLIGCNGYSELTTSSFGYYSRYDEYLKHYTAPGSTPTSAITATDNCYHYNPTATAILAESNCNYVRFVGQADPTLNLPVYTLNTLGNCDVSSLDHFLRYGNNNTNSPPLSNCLCNNSTQTINFLMNPTPLNQNINGVARPIRIPRTSEIKVLCELGYNTTGQYGIRAFGAYKILIGKNNVFEQTNFTNKPMVGISVFNFQNSPVVDADVTITENSFNNLKIGMQCAGADLDINGNTINANNNNSSYGGALLFGCTYTAKNNSINRCYVGIASQSDQNIPNLIKANTFNACIASTWARGNDTGLQIVCNDFDNYLTGICMSNATIVAPEVGVLDDQGSCTTFDPNPADNLFITQVGFGTPPIFAPDLLSNTLDSYKYYYRTTGTDYQPSASANLLLQECPTTETRSENCADFVLSANDVINIAEGTAQDQAMIATIRRLVQIDHDTTAAVNLLATVNSNAAKRIALEYYIKKAMWGAAQQVLNSLPNVTQDEQFFKQLYTIKRDLAQSNRSIFEITATEEATITNIAAYRTRSSFEAQAILYLVRQIEFPIATEHLPLPLPVYTGVLPTIHFKNESSSLSNEQQIIQVYPNPTTGNIQYNVPTDYANCQLTLYSLDGQVCLQQNLMVGNNSFSLHNLSNGLYYYTIYYNGSLLQRNKLILVK